MKHMKQKNHRSQNGRFAKGASGNPTGRPPGSRNKATLLLEELLEDGGESIVRKTLELANSGNMQAARLILERLLPARKQRCIPFELQSVKSAQDLPAAYDSILAAVAEGRITPADGQAIAEILARQAGVLEAAERERRIVESGGRLGLLDDPDFPSGETRGREPESRPME